MTPNPSEETIRVGELVIRFLVTGKDSFGTVAVFEMVVPGGGRLPAPAHSHDGWEETVYGLEGTLTWTVNGRRTDLRPGEALCIPRGAVHRFDNPAAEQAKVLCVITPAVLGPEYFRDTAEVLRATSQNPPDHKKLAEIMRRYGLTPAPPAP